MSDFDRFDKHNHSDDRRILRVLAHVLRDARKQRSCSQERLAFLTGLDRRTVLDVEHARRDMSYLNTRHWLVACQVDWKAFGAALHERDVLGSPVRVGAALLDQMVYARKCEPLVALGVTIRAFHSATGKTVEAVANDADLDPATLSVMQRGDRNPRLRTLRRVVLAVGANWQEFFSVVQSLDPISE